MTTVFVHATVSILHMHVLLIVCLNTLLYALSLLYFTNSCSLLCSYDPSWLVGDIRGLREAMNALIKYVTAHNISLYMQPCTCIIY